MSSNPRIQGWWWWGRRETVEYNGPLITRIAQSKLQHFSKLLLFFPFSRQGHFLLTQPSSPNSFVNRSCTSKSAAATVGLALKSIFLKSPNVMGGGITRSAYPKLASSSSVEAQAEGSPRAGHVILLCFVFFFSDRFKVRCLLRLTNGFIKHIFNDMIYV